MTNPTPAFLDDPRLAVSLRAVRESIAFEAGLKRYQIEAEPAPAARPGGGRSKARKGQGQDLAGMAATQGGTDG